MPRTLTQMLSSIPALRNEMLLAEFQRLVFERRRERVIPTIEKAEHRDYANDLDNLIVAPAAIATSSAARSAALNNGLVW